MFRKIFRSPLERTAGFDLAGGQEAERKLLVTCVNTAPFGVDYSSSPSWTPVGIGVEESAIELNPDVETKTDIFGTTRTKVNKIEPQQSLEPMTIKGNDALGFILNDITERNALSEFSQFEVLIIKAYINDGSGLTPAYRAELHTGCTIVPQSIGGGAYVEQPIDIYLSNKKVIGTASGYKLSDIILFTVADGAETEMTE